MNIKRRWYTSFPFLKETNAEKQTTQNRENTTQTRVLLYNAGNQIGGVDQHQSSQAKLKMDLGFALKDGYFTLFKKLSSLPIFVFFLMNYGDDFV